MRGAEQATSEPGGDPASDHRGMNELEADLMPEHDENDFYDMRPMVAGDVDATGGGTSWKPPLDEPPPDADGRVLIVQDDERDGTTGRFEVHDRFLAHWEGTVRGEARFSTTRDFADVDTALSWARSVARIVTVRLVDESGRTQEYSAGETSPARQLPHWPPGEWPTDTDRHGS